MKETFSAHRKKRVCWGRGEPRFTAGEMEDGWRFEGERRVCLRGSPGQRNRVPRGATSMGSRQREAEGLGCRERVGNILLPRLRGDDQEKGVSLQTWLRSFLHGKRPTRSPSSQIDLVHI